MQKFKTLKKYEDKIQFIVGFTQLTLNTEIPALWVFAVVYHAIQKLAIIKLSHQMASLLNGLPYNMNGPLHMLFKVSVPFIFLIETLSIQYLMALQIALIVLLTLPISHVTLEMLAEIQFHRNQKFRSKNDLQILQSDNLTDYILLMNQIYNQNSYIEGFQYKLMQNSQTILTTRLRQIAIILNYFPQFFFIPLTYFTMELQILVKNHPYVVPVTIFNIILFCQNLLITFLSFNYTQQSFTTNDCNNMQIKQSVLNKIHFFMNLLPIFISFIITITENFSLMNSDLYDRLIVGMIFLSKWVIALERYKSIPFVTQFKIITNLIVYSFIICIATFLLFEYDDNQVITLTMIVFPPLARISVLTGQWRVEHILTNTLRKEKPITPQNDGKQLRIELENQKHRDQQSQALNGINHKYFIHFLRSIEQMQLNKVGVLTRNSQIKLINLRSRLLLVCKILFKSHRENCYNPYCFCRGINSERRRCIEKYEIVKEMRMYDDFRIHNMQFYIEFIMRYIRDYCKLVFQIEIKKQSANFLYLIQLLSFICQSDECYQAQLLILQLKQKMDKAGTQLKERMALQLLFSLNKYQILQRMNLKVTRQQVETTLQFEDYRITEIKRDEILKRIFKNIEIKINFLKQLNTDNHSYTSLENLFIETVEEKQKTDELIMSFNKQSHSKTSLYCDMFYCLEVSNNYDLFVKLYQSMNQRESKFFEHPSFYFNTESSAFKVAYLLINLTQNQNSKRGDIIYSSKNTPELLNFNYIDEKQLKQIDQLLVPSMVQAHDEMLEIFVLTSRPALFRESRQLICQTQEPGIIAYIDLFIDISFQFNNNTLPCYVFIKQIKEGIGLDEIKGVIYMNQNLIIEGITQTALQMLKLEQNVLYKQDGRQVFPEIHIILEEFEQELQQYFINNPVEDETEQTLTTQEKLIQKYSKFVDDVKMIIIQQEYQIDMEITMSYSKVNKLVYKSYIILIKNIYKMIHNLSQDSPVHKTSMNEVQSSSNVRIRLKKYTDDLPIVTQTKEEQTLRSQFNQSEHEIKPLNEQQDFLNSEYRQKSESEQSEQHSKQQKDNYINSVSSGTTKISEIQKILIKSNFYTNFSNMKSQPFLLILILIINVISFAFIILSASISFKYYDQWQQNTSDNLEILQAFIMRSYSRGTQQGTSILLYTLYEFSSDKLDSNLQKELVFDETKFQMLQNILNQNIDQFTDLMDLYQENKIIRDLFTNIQLKQLDLFTSEINTVDGWTALFQLIYMMQNLKIIGNDDYFQFSKSLIYLIQSYKQYKDAYGILQTQLNSELYNILDQYDQIIINVRAITICFLIFILITTFIVNYSYFQLVKKYLRCCEQISHSSIIEEQNYLQDLLLIQDSFELYEQDFSIKDKFNIDLAQGNSARKRNGSMYKEIDNSKTQNNKKYISINYKTNYQRKMYFLLENISYIIFFIFYIVQSLQDQAQIFNIKNNILIYQKFISLTESVSETCMTNYVLQTQDVLILFNIINETQAEEFAQYSNQSYYSANQLLSQIFIQNSQFQSSIKQLTVGNVCEQLVNEKSSCEFVQDGILTGGILSPLSNLLSVVRDNIQLYYQKNKSLELFQLDDLLVQNYSIEAVFEFVNMIRTQMQNDLIKQNQQNIITWLCFYIILIIANTIQIYKTHKYKYDKIYKIRQQVFILPPKSLYLEESYYKTLSYMTKIENKLIHL